MQEEARRAAELLATLEDTAGGQEAAAEEAAAEASMETMVVQVCNLLKLAKTAHTDMDMMVDSALGKILQYAMVKARGIRVVVEAQVDMCQDQVLF